MKLFDSGIGTDLKVSILRLVLNSSSLCLPL